MQRSSESIASLAAALAKAQIALVNPEKSLVATIAFDGPTRGERAFRYASLSSGLDIVRKVLGQHEIATVQTTSVDQTAGFINLTTVLAHASGEWIASDWPVCAVSETAIPHRMGAALTYARRYALFTLVGIAGEDDLDLPDLATPTSRSSPPEQTTSKVGLNGGQGAPDQRNQEHRPRVRSSVPWLEPEASAQLRDQLIAGLAEIRSADGAALWALRNLREKNNLTADDARVVEESFQTKVRNFGEPAPSPEHAEQPPPSPQANQKQSRRPRSKIDKAALVLPVPRRIRDRVHVKYVATQPCLICGRHPADAHHLRFAQDRALGRKVSDEFTVPLCRGHHREVHHRGDEAGWWSNIGIDAIVAARTLWLKTHPTLSDFDRHGSPDNDRDAARSKHSEATADQRCAEQSATRKTKRIGKVGVQ